MQMQNSSLEMGAILRAWLPYDEKPNVAGPKFRPVIFLADTFIDGKRHWIVAYGTTNASEMKESKNGGDFIIRCTEDRGFVINSDTRFDFNRVRALPATTEFFSSKATNPVAKVAAIPEMYIEQAVQCMHNANVGQTLRRLGVRHI